MTAKRKRYLDDHVFTKLYYDRKIQKNGLQSRASVPGKKSPCQEKSDRVAGNIRSFTTLGIDAATLFRYAEEGTIRIVR